MKRNKFFELIGFRFIVNHNTKEIHRVKSLTPQCHVDKMTDRGYATKWQVNRLLLRGYDGCNNCYSEKHSK